MFVDALLLSAFSAERLIKMSAERIIKKSHKLHGFPMPPSCLVFTSKLHRFPVQLLGFCIGSCCRTTFKDVGRTTHKEVAQIPRLPYASVVFGTREHRTRLQKTLFQHHFLHHKFHTSDLGLKSSPVCGK